MYTFSPCNKPDVEVREDWVINRPKNNLDYDCLERTFEHIFLEVKKKQLLSWTLIELLGPEALITSRNAKFLALMYTHCCINGCSKVYAVCANAMQARILRQAAKAARVELELFSSASDCFEKLKKRSAP